MALDAALFQDKGWFVIDEHNDRVPRVVVATLADGLALVDQGAVRTVVGRLRSQFKVVDVDLAGARGHDVTAQLGAWCRGRGLWHLVRPSGGTDGRHHIFVAPEDQSDALESFVARLRGTFRAARHAIDLRHGGAVRPLSAPHRHGGHTRPLGAPAALLTDLQRRQTRTIIPRGRRSATAAAAAFPLPPRPRRRTELPAAWSTYLRTGAVPRIGGSDHSRTTVEAIATGHLLRAGHSAESAWGRIITSHPGAMTRAKASKRRWIAWVWNREVQDDLASTAGHRKDSPILEEVQAARQRLWALQWTLSPRQRPALLLVGHHVLDRMQRTGTRRVPVPERDLQLDTGIRDRKTIRAALRHLDGPIGVLHTDSWDATKPEGSSFEFEISIGPPPAEHVQQGWVWEIPPPSTHTPLPTGSWAVLPRLAHSLWRVLPAASGLTITRLCQLAGVTESPTTVPTPSQIRTATAALAALAAAGLAACSADALWVLREATSPRHAVRAEGAYVELHARISTEREAFRSPASSTWNLTRARVLKANQARQQAWWDDLDPTVRSTRRAAWVGRFEELGVLDREQVKADLASRRLRAGLIEAVRHDAWISDQPGDSYLERVVTRQQWFAALAPPLRQANAAAWARHRNRFSVPKASTLAAQRIEYANLLPDGPTERNRTYLHAERSDWADGELELRATS